MYIYIYILISSSRIMHSRGKQYWLRFLMNYLVLRQRQCFTLVKVYRVEKKRRKDDIAILSGILNGSKMVYNFFDNK